MSAVVITYNDEKHLEKCLNNLSVCDQLLVVDLGSSDQSALIGKKYATTFLTHKWEPIAEFVLPEILDLIEYEWVVRADPDEIYPYSLLEAISQVIYSDDLVSRYSIPFQYYFGNIPLKNTVWGGVRYFGNKIFNLQRVILSKRVHGSIEDKNSYIVKNIPYSGTNAVQHFWVNDFKDFYIKHKRYLRLEGKSRYERGERFSLRFWVNNVLKSIYKGFIVKKGLFGSALEFSLSLLYVWYISSSILALKKFSKNINKYS